MNNAVPTKHFDLPPYRAEAMGGDRWGVVNRDGFNCLSFPDKPGAKFSTIERAHEIAAEWNSRWTASKAT